MNKLKLIQIHMLGGLLVSIVTLLPVIANAQDSATGTMTANLTNIMPAQDVYCDTDDAYSPIATAIANVSSANNNLHLCPRVPVSGNLSSIPRTVVDWVLVELRAVPNGGTAGSTAAGEAAGSTVVARKPAFLLTNGRIVDAAAYVTLFETFQGTLSGTERENREAEEQHPNPCTGVIANANCPDVEFDQGNVAREIENKDLYLVIRHRNHLDIISRQHLTESTVQGEGGVYAYDFSTGATQALGATALKVKENTPVMPGGDANSDNSVGFGEYNSAVVANDRSRAYLASDLNMDQSTGFSDFNNLLRPNQRRRTQVPN